MRSAARIAIGAAVAVLILAPVGAWMAWIARSSIDPRVRLDGTAVGEGAGRIEEWVSARSRERLESALVLRYPSGEVLATLEEMGFYPLAGDTVDRLRRASRALHSGDPLASLSSWSALREGRSVVHLSIGLETAVLTDYLVDLKSRVDEAPLEARIDFATGGVLDHEDGFAIELHTAAAAIEGAVRAGRPEVDLPFSPLKPEITAQALRSLDRSVVLASFTTTFPRMGRNADRAFNVAHGASKLDGSIILPGRTMSFNAIVGERSLEAGFREAPEIYEGEMVEGVGGGTCQVSSTFHAAVLYAGLDIVERYPHSRPSSYIRMGLDATVSYPTVDLRVGNPFPFPVVIRAVVDGGRLTIEVLGPAKPASVDFRTIVLERTPFEERVEEDSTIPEGVVYVVQYGLPGYLVSRIRTITFSDGSQKVVKDRDTYPPTAHIVRVAPGTGYTGLPSLKHVDASPADEGGLAGEDLEERPADFAAPEAAYYDHEAVPWKIVDGPFAHPPRPESP